MIAQSLRETGAFTRRFFAYFGQLAALGGELLRSLAPGRIRIRPAVAQAVSIGFGSQLVVVVTGAFTGAVLAAQAFYKFSEIGLASATGPVVSIAMCRELGPVLAALMVAGRMGAAMAAEIGTMRVTEQIDALRSMGVAPTEYLVTPRALAAAISMPVLVAEAVLFGILAADLLTVRVFGVPEAWFRAQIMDNTGTGDVLAGLIKGVVFGQLIVLISCHQGLTASGGAAGVGLATRRAVVHSSLAVLISNLFLTFVLNRWFPSVSVQL